MRGVQPSLIEDDIDTVVIELTKRLAPKVLENNIEFTIIPSKGRTVAKINITLLHEAITNLIENALQHGGPTLSEIIVKVTKKRQEISISVENDGTKIKDNQIKSCFERFSQIGESGGAGLGLALVNEIAKLHNGSLTVSSKTSMKFTFSIPT